MELRQLEYFLAVARERHFTRAAESIPISQPTLSQQIKALEHELGMPLFDRLGKQVTLTEAGDALVGYARGVLDQLSEARDVLAELRGLERGTLAIGAVQTISAYLVPIVAGHFQRAHPTLRLSLETLHAEEIYAGLRDHSLDLGVCYLPESYADLEGELLFQEELVLVVHREHALAARTEMTMAELARHSLVLLKACAGNGQCVRKKIEEAFAEAGVAPDVGIELNSIESAKAAVKAGYGISLFPKIYATGVGADPELRLIRLHGPTPRREMAIVWQRGRFQRTAARAFRKALLDHTAAMRTQP